MQDRQMSFLERAARRAPRWGHELPRAGLELLTRLRKGQAWLLERWPLVAELPAPSTGSGRAEETDLQQQYLEAFDLWCRLEMLVRGLYGFTGCVIGTSGCDTESPAMCQACQRALMTEEDASTTG